MIKVLTVFEIDQVMAAAVVKVILMYYCIICLTSDSANNNLLHCGNCLCPEGVLVFSCHVNGGVATVWKGSIFNCPGNPNESEVTLNHSLFDNGVPEPRICNDGNIVAYNIDVTNNIYTSQTNVTVSPKMHKGTAECVQYTFDSTSVLVGTYTLILNAIGIC